MRVLYRILAQRSNRGCSNATGVQCHILYIFTDHIGRYLNTSVQAILCCSVGSNFGIIPGCSICSATYMVNSQEVSGHSESVLLSV